MVKRTGTYDDYLLGFSSIWCLNAFMLLINIYISHIMIFRKKVESATFSIMPFSTLFRDFYFLYSIEQNMTVCGKLNENAMTFIIIHV
jgi:hypothetical protein